ncbi:replication-associated recombination protein A [uncultured Actinomyces sp.]|uniref:replication-associated recombination protein A n=1 Tax=uncultured Actinomyces sp. TaxID=249061 RepID=UPI0028E9CB63|nr:replication-associated recombination protein A [uncultured Actinomyces sp.]
MDLFDTQGIEDFGTPVVDDHAPLAVRMRPQSADEIVGQQHLLKPGSPLRRLLTPSTDSPAGLSSVILWGPPGTGKTTLAYLIARASGRRFCEVSAVTSGVKDLRDVISQARRGLTTTGEETILFVDEVHRFSKSQQDALLPAVENRWVTLVAATTENPSFSVISPLLSRSLLLTLHALSSEDLSLLLDRALTSESGLKSLFSLSADARSALLRLAGADARKALTLLEAAAASCIERGGDGQGVEEESGPREIEIADVENAANQALVRWDQDQHYDVASAFIKSMRGSDVDAAIHYLARMLEAGEDPRFIARRIMICAAEDVGMAAPEVLTTAVSAAQAVAMVGMPEARIILSEAVIAVAAAPKSNRAYLAIDEALRDIRQGKGGPVPTHLRDAHYSGAQALGHGVDYIYAHDAPHHVAAQHYLPEDLRGTSYYRPTTNGNEAMLTKRLAALRELLKVR